MPYPLSNRRTSLTIDYFAIRRAVGEMLEITMADEEWDHEQNEVVRDIIRDGLQLYYYPPLLPAEYAAVQQEVHEWSFMRPIWQWKTASGQRTYVLPEDFERPVGPITQAGSDDSGLAPIAFTAPANLRAAQLSSNETGRPYWAAIEPVEWAGDEPQNLRVVLQPTPDAVYSLELQYQATGQMIDADHPFPMGGQIHGPGILLACLSVAEFRKTGESGGMDRRFKEMLASNIIRDRQRGPRNLGQNTNPGQDPIVSRAALRAIGGIWVNSPLYGGTDYGS